MGHKVNALADLRQGFIEATDASGRIETALLRVEELEHEHAQMKAALEVIWNACLPGAYRQRWWGDGVRLTPDISRHLAYGAVDALRNIAVDPLQDWFNCEGCGTPVNHDTIRDGDYCVLCFERHEADRKEQGTDAMRAQKGKDI